MVSNARPEIDDIIQEVGMRCAMCGNSIRKKEEIVSRPNLKTDVREYIHISCLAKEYAKIGLTKRKPDTTDDP